MSSVSLYRKSMIFLMERIAPTAGFLSSFAQTPPENIFNSETVEIDIVRNKMSYAVDIVPHTGARFNKNTKYTTKEYTPPAYKEAFTLTGKDLQYKPAGVNPYDASKVGYVAQAVETMMKNNRVSAQKIKYAIEKQARDAYFSGKITLINGDEIDFNKKTTHAITPSVKWDNASGKPVDDLTNACDVIRTDAMLGASTFDLILEDTVLNALLDNAQVKERGNYRRIDLVNISMPQGMNSEGATFHGVMSAGSNTINLWTYNAKYEIPTGFGLDDEGTKENFIPQGEGLLIARGVRFDIVYGGIPQIVDYENVALPIPQAEKMLPFIYVDRENQVVKYGLESRPLFIPTEIDGFATFKSMLTV